MSGEGVEVMVEGVRLGDRATEAAGDWGLGMRGDVGELFDELVGDGLVRCEGTAGESDGLVGGGVGAFA